MRTHYQVLIIGGGTAGIMVASQLKRKNASLEIGLIEPSDKHYYQPAWTLVGANTYKFKDTVRPMASLIPKGVDWIKEYADVFKPEQNSLITKNGTELTYDYLVVVPGLKIAPELVEGLTEAMEKGVVCSNYTDPNHTWETLKNFNGGTALFTQPTTPIKCGGAPQKIMYLADDYFRKTGVRKKSDIVFALPSGSIFGVKIIADTLMNVVDRKDINVRFFHKLVKVDADKKIAWYEIDKDLTAGGCVTIADGDVASLDRDIQYNYKDVKVTREVDRFGIHFDMMHLAPPQCAPDFIRNSPLAAETGWVSVDPKTTQHTKYPNIFSLGDVSNLPTSKTGAAIRKQVPVTVANILKLIEVEGLSSKEYNGYTSCPLVTGYGKMVLAEFDYDKNFEPDPKLKKFPMMLNDSSKEHWRLWMLKKYGLPYLYWNKMMKGIEV
ncbi:NAD(P)/FAD-dependent oxidoreductase [Flavobacteriaceae bacterium S0825]|uniref:NAD(P)/FAD-dependent oxidoreductase n=1 Tax=Gaetbulibacter sp. S0825 TaxID=2720084 RepID=UPI001430AEB3|nr:FAD/NAD(P)-binding oxidoreductase [Gaetbulibacter sp. S0825]MCK0109968.1 NAD(P)/FAD-dependent oxidoreductase [Flavobacteriaceae bacterium S0825]NIX65597.1 NAD(P)/FAD-dependent oxidoreductase [Gaetbulibacter sp. S0825]